MNTLTWILGARRLTLILAAALLLPTSASALSNKEFVQACFTLAEVNARGGRNTSPDEAYNAGFCDAAIQSFRSTYLECGIKQGVDVRGFARTIQTILAEQGPSFGYSSFGTITQMAFERLPVRATERGRRCVDQPFDRLLFSQ